MEKIYKVENRDVGLKVTARTPLLFNEIFHEDMFDILENADTNDAIDRAFMKVAFVMAKQFDDSLTTFDDWADSFEKIPSLYELSGYSFELFNISNKTEVEPKKEVAQSNEE